MNIFRRIFKGVLSFFTPDGQKRINEACEQVEILLREALPIVEFIVKLTPTKSDDEILVIVKRYVPSAVLRPESLTEQEKNLLLRQAAVNGLKERIITQPDKIVPPDRVLDLAVQAAYTAYRAAQK